jgi:CRP-like cAMP-binding protein/small-conductance mechanosensitive channel
MGLLGSLRLVIPLGVAIVLFAALFRMVPSAPRHRLRRSVILYALYFCLVGIGLGVSRLGAPSAVLTGLRVAAELLELLLIINLAALAVFDLLLRWSQLRVPDILHDVAVGAAYLLAVAWSMHRWGVNLTSIVATSAVVTAVIGLSLQSTLGNVIGGLALQIDDSINEGDWIELESKAQGQVKKVRWRHTVIETRDFDTLIVPNGQLLTQTIKILGKREGFPVQHRMWVYFNVDHRYAPGHVIRIVDAALQAAPFPSVALEPKPHAICFDLARDHRDSFCYYAVRYFLTDLARDDPTSSLVRERIYSALRRAQIPLALPAAALFISQEDEKRERKSQERIDEFRAALQRVELFSRLSREELAVLSESAKAAPFVQGEVVTRQGAKANWLYVLMSGEVEVRVKSTDGEERRVAVMSAPDFFGEMALMTGAPREATVIALTDVECLRVDKDDFRKVLEQRPELANEISVLLAQRRVELDAARENLDAESRTSRVLLERRRILASIKDFFGLES